MGFLYPHSSRDRAKLLARSETDRLRLPSNRRSSATIPHSQNSKDVQDNGHVHPAPQQYANAPYNYAAEGAPYNQHEALGNPPSYAQYPLTSDGHDHDSSISDELLDQQIRTRRELDPEQAARREARQQRRAERQARRHAEQDRYGSYTAPPTDSEQIQRGYEEDHPQPPARAYTAGFVPSALLNQGREHDTESSHVKDPSALNTPLIHDDQPPTVEPETWKATSEKTAWHVDGWNHHHDDNTAYDKEKGYSSSRSSAYDELSWYKRTQMPDPHAYIHNRRRQYCLIGAVVTTVIALIIIIVAAVVATHGKYHYVASTAQVNNTAAFINGGATTANVNSTNDGNGAGNDSYTYYSGNASAFPSPTHWVSFSDMWTANLPVLQNACTWLKAGHDDSAAEIAAIYAAIQDRATASLVDHRVILAVILQESHGCVRVGSTTSSTGVHNPGLMQSHAGHGYDSRHSAVSIMAMVQDGTQGTASGAGLVQALNDAGDVYTAARVYNSGYVPASGNLSETAGATACYVSDVANRLMGWVMAQSSCVEGD